MAFQDKKTRIIPSICPRCEARLKRNTSSQGELFYIHPAKPAKDGTYITAILGCTYAGAVLTHGQLRHLHEHGFLPVSFGETLNIIPPDRQPSIAELRAISRLKSAARANRKKAEHDEIVDGWYRRAYEYMIECKSNVLH